MSLPASAISAPHDRHLGNILGSPIDASNRRSHVTIQYHVSDEGQVQEFRGDRFDMIFLSPTVGRCRYRLGGRSVPSQMGAVV